MWTLHQKDPEALRILVELGADVNIPGQSHIHTFIHSRVLT